MWKSKLGNYIRGDDFSVLETYTKYVHNLTDSFGIQTECFAVPGKSSHIKLFYPSSANVEHTYDLTKYERVVQVEDVPSTKLPIIIEALKLNAPAGVEVTIKKPDADEEENRYIPDRDLLELKEKIEEIEGKKSDIKKGKY